VREFEFVLAFKAQDEVEAAFFIETKFLQLIKEVRETRDAYGYVREISSGKQFLLDHGHVTE
jgi:hypothetical protein